MERKVYRHLDKLPSGRAGDTLTNGCIVLEGGGWKGLYTLGVLDCLMMNDINFTSVVGCSAGALSAIGYVSGQIGWGARIDLTYRHDWNYCGIGALLRDHGITGFSYLFKQIIKELPLDRKRLSDPSRRLAVSATNMLTGKVEYFEKGRCNLSRAVQASATVPYVSMPVKINGVPYLDGGCAEKIPFPWAESSGEKKIVVVRTRELSYRREPGLSRAARFMYRRYPELLNSMEKTNGNFNSMVGMLEEKALAGEIFLIAPSKPVTVTRFDGDMDKLGALYLLGFSDMKSRLAELRGYLGK
ncbi:Predicted phospholipase, patatin/cPLA2 family [Ruminococcus sp. YRD2003]|uniref:patatin-like phospholipase family protein n=1 Tax=Ruminococcus sp. YRD2003 TaxID=1452313 RepID=UPI0008C16F4B|nr:Predicted phospholipase, patatin/cPLA2 family [Ruminococcus flavefaciens]